MNLEKALKDYGNMGPKAREEDMYAAAAMEEWPLFKVKKCRCCAMEAFCGCSFGC